MEPCLQARGSNRYYDPPEQDETTNTIRFFETVDELKEALQQFKTRYNQRVVDRASRPSLSKRAASSTHRLRGGRRMNNFIALSQEPSAIHPHHRTRTNSHEHTRVISRKHRSAKR